MRRTIAVSIFGLGILSGCATISQEKVFDSLNDSVKNNTSSDLQWIKNDRQARQIDESVNTMLSHPLGMEDAVRIALINNRGLQQTYEELGIAQSELVQAGLMRNPLLGYSLGRGGGTTTSEISVEFAFLDLLWIPLRKELSGLALEETQLKVAQEVLNVVHETRKGFIDALTAQQTTELDRELLLSYETSLQLAVRQYSAGNLSKRDYLRVRDRYNRARIEAIRHVREMAISRESLNQKMGLYGKQTDYSLASIAPIPQILRYTSENLERVALQKRMDVAAAKKAVEYAFKDGGYTRNTRFLEDVTLEGKSEKSSGEARRDTLGIQIPIPLFDMGQGRIGLAEARYNQSVHRLHELAVNVRSQTREAYASLLYAHDMVREYRDNIVANQAILQETQLLYNGMLEGIDELLEDQRHVNEAKIDALGAAGEYWKAQADLIYTIGGEIPVEKE